VAAAAEVVVAVAVAVREDMMDASRASFFSQAAILASKSMGQDRVESGSGRGLMEW